MGKRKPVSKGVGELAIWDMIGRPSSHRIPESVLVESVQNARTVFEQKLSGNVNPEILYEFVCSKYHEKSTHHLFGTDGDLNNLFGALYALVCAIRLGRCRAPLRRKLWVLCVQCPA